MGLRTQDLRANRDRQRSEEKQKGRRRDVCCRWSSKSSAATKSGHSRQYPPVSLESRPVAAEVAEVWRQPFLPTSFLSPSYIKFGRREDGDEG